jgi:hypothetical protein
MNRPPRSGALPETAARVQRALLRAFVLDTDGNNVETV